jgi:glycopeptide antibiotics resistance protein
MIILTSTAIEIVQLLTNRGIFEIADLLTNTIGGVIGITVAYVVEKIREKFKWNFQGRNS